MEVVRSDRSDDVRVSNDRVTIYQPRVERGGDNYRPSQSRNAENVRGNSRVEQKNPRSNDPGLNRRSEDRNTGRQEEIRRENTERRGQQGVQPSERNKEKQGAVEAQNSTERKKEGNNVNPGKREQKTKIHLQIIMSGLHMGNRKVEIHKVSDNRKMNKSRMLDLEVAQDKKQKQILQKTGPKRNLNLNQMRTPPEKVMETEQEDSC
ncbi:MAG: hypothetical protein IPH45_04425 [Bacteroidales bacterium]|nr:hypothetical protein [Bacteroidales bacterium]